MDRLLSCTKIDVELADAKPVPSSRLASFRHRLPPLTLLPCGQRPADPSPPATLAEDAVRPAIASWSGRIERLTDRYLIISTLGRGTFGSVLLGECRSTRRATALKKLPKATTKLSEFLREFNYGRQMSLTSSGGHPGIVVTYDDAFETRSSYVFAQEFAPCGDLLAAVSAQNRAGLGETRTKRVARQIVSALAFIHARRVVHRDVKPENIMLYDPSCRLVKLADFGVARRAGTIVCRICPGTAYTPPEICGRETGSTYRVETATDVWAFGIVLFAMLTANFPWRLARLDTEDRLFADFARWQEKCRRRSATSVAMSDPWTRFTEAFVGLIHRLLELRQERRAQIDAVAEFLVADVAWLSRRSDRLTRRRTLTEAETKDRQIADLCTAIDDSMMDQTSRTNRVNYWLHNGQISTVESTS